MLRNHNKPPMWVRAVLTIGDFVVRHFYPCFVNGLHNYTASPATIVISNHRRDLDGPLLGSVLLRRHDMRLAAPLPHFVAREDLFERGFLAHYVRNWPTPLRSLLAAINLRRFLTRCGAYPLQRTHERNVAEVLHEVVTQLGDMRACDALRPNRLESLARICGFNPCCVQVTDLVRDYSFELWRIRYGYRHLRLKIFRRIKPYQRQTIESQIDHFTGLLQHGQMVILEPEGRLSLDGHLRRPRSALHEFINRPRRPVRVLPVSVTYDTMTIDNARIFVDIHPEMTELHGLARQQLDQCVMTTLRAGCRVTGGQIAAGFFLFHLSRDDNWTDVGFMSHLREAARACHSAGFSLDPVLLEQQGCDKRARDILAWAIRAGLLSSDDGRFRVINPSMPPPWLPDGPTSLLDYLRAELQDTVGKAIAYDLGLIP